MNGIRGITRLGTAAVLTACTMACDGYGPTAPREEATAGLDTRTFETRIQGPRPLRGSLRGITVFGPRCGSDPPGFVVRIQAGGIVSHLGDTSLRLTACVSAGSPAPGPNVVSLTAANGHRLDGILTALTWTAHGFDLDIAVTGGTGRFAQAGGKYILRERTVSSPPFPATLEGWVEY